MELILTRPTVPEPPYGATIDRYVDSHRPKHLYAGFAYITLSGVTQFLHSIKSPHWETIVKRFVIGISQGISEPEAIRRLTVQPGLEVRLCVPGSKLTTSALFDTKLFHPKVLFFEGGGEQRRSFISVGSANLTGRATGLNPSNYECSQITLINNSKEETLEIIKFRTWWNNIWGQGVPATASILNRYADLRVNSFSRNPDLLQLTEPAPTIGDAQTMWIEVGKASGIERHQVEFPLSLASFFGPPVHKRIDLCLESGNRHWVGRPLSHKRTSFGVDIWRLGSPTIHMGGVPIQNRVVRFARTTTPLTFKFEVADTGSSKVKSWVRECSRLGHLGRTAGSHSRAFGYL
jgi:hypothetical protein